MPLTPAEKQAAYRQRQRDSQADFAGPVEQIVARSSSNDALELYVAYEVAVTRAQTSDPERLARTESYARWRWREYQAGLVAAL